MSTPQPENRKNWIKGLVDRHWNPQPVPPPSVDPELKQLTGLQRAAEVLRYSVLSIEWWLAPSGTLRCWLRLNGLIGSFLLVPAVLVCPIVTLILWQVAKWMGLLSGISGNLLAAVIATALIAAVVTLIRVILGK